MGDQKNKDKKENDEICVETRVEKVAMMLEKAKLADYVNIMTTPRALLFNNFVGGLARGFGMAIGFTLLGALVLYTLKQAMLLNLPFIGNFISEIVKIVQDNLIKH